jgi:hypothetical protein
MISGKEWRGGGQEAAPGQTCGLCWNHENTPSTAYQEKAL